MWVIDGRRFAFDGVPRPTGSEVRPPLAGKRAAARRLAAQVRERLEPVQRVLPVKPTAAAPERVQPPEPTPQDAAARIDAARERLRASIQAPADPDA